MAQLLSKRIPISEERWKQLGRIKQAGQTYDELMKELIQARNRMKLARKMDEAEKGKGKWYSLDDV